MTDETAIEKVLMHIAETRGQWDFFNVNNQKMMRRRSADGVLSVELCPMLSLAGDTDLASWKYTEAGKRVGISADCSLRVAATADDNRQNGFFSPTLRADMLRAAGLEEMK